MILNYSSGKRTEEQDLMSALKLTRFTAPIISVVGAGGKTTVVERLAREYKEKNQSVIVTTTTHMKQPEDGCFLAKPDMEHFVRLLKFRRDVWMGIPDQDGKMRAFPFAFLEAVRILEIPIIIEADGANGLPCKVPAAHEPVLWEKSMIVLGVVGLDAVGRPIKEVCHRPDETAGFLKKEKEELLTPQDIVSIGTSERGLRKSMDPFMKYHIILNKADTKERLRLGEEIAELFREQGEHHVLLTADLGGRNENTDQRSR